MDCSETSTCHVREEAFPLKCVCFSEVKREEGRGEKIKRRSKRCSRRKPKHSFHICVSFCWFFSEEGLTSCYKNIFIFVTIVELQDKSSVRNTAPAKVRLQCHFHLTSPFSLSLSVSVPVSRCCSPTSSNKWVQTGMWYWRQCSWYFLSVMSQFSAEWRWGTGGYGKHSSGGTQRDGKYRCAVNLQSNSHRSSNSENGKGTFSSVSVCPTHFFFNWR